MYCHESNLKIRNVGQITPPLLVKAQKRIRKIKKGEVFVKITGSILEHVAKILGWTNDGYEQGIILAISEWLKNIGK